MPVLKNQALEDESFKRCFKLFLSRQVISQAGPEVLSLGKDVLSDQVFAWVTDAERNKPYIKRSGRDAYIPLGLWAINGSKWFSSVTDSEMTIMLARTPAGGLSTFLAPMRKHDPNGTTATGEPDPNGQILNGIRIQRLKNKFGTQSLPTAELVLENTRGWLIGQEGRGIQEISSILTLTRIRSTFAAVGGVGRDLGSHRTSLLTRTRSRRRTQNQNETPRQPSAHEDPSQAVR
ncbi:hypothetical protein E4U17_000332 [Claviceps sp. LM77 group G4]|nr:hypothetical protein E4U17_000332 [Claviceps sp. LM77 group G4]KAG6052980.1 hypothetical protein E4U33_000342 [Claviceps sp. LM78 group G4]KAG6067796.1 hypothetical protein E4U16_008106 [Claviceps sp. LM84 group G4]